MKTRFVLGIGIAAMTFAASSAFAATPLYFLDHNDLNGIADGARISSWGGVNNAKETYNNGLPMLGPTAETIFGQKWEKNVSADYNDQVSPTIHSRGDGFRIAAPTSSIAINGASFIVAAIRGPQIPSNNWESIIDVMYDKLVLGIANDTGKIVVRRNGSLDWSDTAIAVGQSTILSMTVQADGAFEVWADGVSMLSRGANGTMTEWDLNRTEFKDEPDWAAAGVASGNWDAWWASQGLAPWSWDAWWAKPQAERDLIWGHTAPVPGFKKFIAVGRNEPDSWTAFNGNIGDVKIFGEALSNTERLGLVSDMTTAMGMGAPVPEPASILAMFSGLVGLAGFGIRRRK